MVLNVETLDWMTSVTKYSTTKPGETFVQGKTSLFSFTSRETIDAYKIFPVS